MCVGWGVHTNNIENTDPGGDSGGLGDRTSKWSFRWGCSHNNLESMDCAGDIDGSQRVVTQKTGVSGRGVHTIILKVRILIVIGGSEGVVT